MLRGLRLRRRGQGQGTEGPLGSRWPQEDQKEQRSDLSTAEALRRFKGKANQGPAEEPRQGERPQAPASLQVVLGHREEEQQAPERPGEG